MTVRFSTLLRVIALTAIAATSPFARAEPNECWPRFRGPTAMGVAEDDPKLPETWSKTENVDWVTEVPGWGWSGPINAGRKVFLTAVINDDKYEMPQKGLYLGQGRQEPPKTVHHWMVYCLDLDSGEIVWKHEAHRGLPQAPRHPKSTYASETPVTDGERVYTLFGDLGLFSYDLNGNLLWSHKIKPEPSIFGYGAAASPVVCGDSVIVLYDNQGQSFLAAFDKKTGKQLWRANRDERSTWATPFVWKNEQRTEIITNGYNEVVRSYDPAGKLLWTMKGPMSNLVIPSPFASHGNLFITSGYIGDRERPIYVMRPGAEGRITLPENPAEHESMAWHLPMAGPYNTSPIVYRDRYYTVHDRGFLTCHDARTGEEVFDKARFPGGASFTSSPWAYNGKVFCLSEDGQTYVLDTGNEFKILATNSLDELCMACPAVVQGKLLLRTASKLYCISDHSTK